MAGRERRVSAPIYALPYWSASTAHFAFEMTVESFLNVLENEDNRVTSDLEMAGRIASGTVVVCEADP